MEHFPERWAESGSDQHNPVPSRRSNETQGFPSFLNTRIDKTQTIFDSQIQDTSDAPKKKDVRAFASF